MFNDISVADLLATLAHAGKKRVRVGPRPNKYKPRPTVVRNPLVAKQMNEMHDKWMLNVLC